MSGGRPLWQIGVQSVLSPQTEIGRLLKKIYMEPIMDFDPRPDELHILSGGLFDASGRQIPRKIEMEAPHGIEHGRYIELEVSS